MEHNNPQHRNGDRQSPHNIISLRLKRNIKKPRQLTELINKINDKEIKKESANIKKCNLQYKTTSTFINSFRSTVHNYIDKEDISDMFSF